jgi:large subunit ribosomal protein L25
MLSLKAKKRELIGKKVKELRRQDILPGVLYGPKIENLTIELDLKEFEKTYKEAGESSLLSLKVGEEEFSVLIHEVKKDPLTSRPIHVDFYQPILTEEVEATVPIVFEGEALAVKDLGGTLIKEIQEIEVKALPQNLPHEIKVNIDKLKTLEDEILVKDLKVAENVKIQKEPNETVANVAPPETEKIEQELEKPVEEKVEEVEEAEEKKEAEEEQEKPAESPSDNQAGKKDEEK